MAITLDVLDNVVCPACSLPLVADRPVSEDSLPRALQCNGCGRKFPVSTSLISFVADLKEQERTASGFGFEWNAFWKGFFDKGDVFGLNFQATAQYFLSSTGLRQTDLGGLKILDAGTGSGRIPISLQGMGCRVSAVDIHESLDVVAQRFATNPTVHFFRADLLNLPFRNGHFDVAWSSGVIHHTPDPSMAFDSIARTVRPGGRMFVSVYGTDLHHYRMFRHFLPFARHLPVSFTFAISAVLAAPLYIGFNTALTLLRLRYGKQPPPYHFFRFTVENIEYKSYRSILLNLFDQLHPKYQSEHSVDEVRGWFLKNGFEDLAVTESIGMVGIRGSKKK